MRGYISSLLTCVLFTLLVLGARQTQAQTPGASKGAAPPEVLQAEREISEPSLPIKTTTTPKETARAVTIASGDLLEVTVYGLEDMAQRVRVDSDGNVSLQLLGQVHVAGLTPQAAEKQLDALSVQKGILKDPHFAVFVKEDVQGGVSVLGEVSKPGIYELEGTRHLLEVISAAGGVTNKAGSTANVTRRDDPGRVIAVKLTDEGQDPASNVPIYPGDTVVVSKAPLVYVVGEVQRPSGLVMENGEPITVLQAIALAQGTTKNAKLGSTRIIRKSADGSYQEIPLALGDMLKAKKPDIALQKEDILFIPTSLTKTVMGSTLQSAVQIAVGAAIYRP
jgi:polysaccharide biosynthesis/export protein